MSLTMQSGILLTKKNDRTANLSRSLSTGVPITVTAVYEQKHPPRSNRNIPANGHRIREKNMNKLNKAWECNLRSTGIILDNLRYILYIYIHRYTMDSSTLRHPLSMPLKSKSMMSEDFPLPKGGFTMKPVAADPNDQLC